MWQHVLSLLTFVTLSNEPHYSLDMRRRGWKEKKNFIIFDSIERIFLVCQSLAYSITAHWLISFPYSFILIQFVCERKLFIDQMRFFLLFEKLDVFSRANSLVLVLKLSWRNDSKENIDFLVGSISTKKRKEFAFNSSCLTVSNLYVCLYVSSQSRVFHLSWSEDTVCYVRGTFEKEQEINDGTVDGTLLQSSSLYQVVLHWQEGCDAHSREYPAPTLDSISQEKPCSLHCSLASSLHRIVLFSRKENNITHWK